MSYHKKMPEQNVGRVSEIAYGNLYTLYIYLYRKRVLDGNFVLDDQWVIILR
jgi:hypothetical protein